MSSPIWQLSRWQVFEVQLPGRAERTRHFAGYSLALRVSKITLPIIELDPRTRRGTDETGEIYALIGRSRVDEGVAWSWKNWAEGHEAADVLKISKAVTKALVQHPDCAPFKWRRQ